MYGKGIRLKNNAEASMEARKVRGNRRLFRVRARADLKVLQSYLLVDAKKVAAIGYCFGGTGIAELARSGADIAGGVSFYGGLDTPNPKDAKI
ncbi:MAG: dienelactone hydrolase family protein [bacterium JZ-2024 1]